MAYSTRNRLVKLVAADTQLTQDKVAEVIAVIRKTMIEALRRGEDVRIDGFGTFYVHKLPAMKGWKAGFGWREAKPERLTVKFYPHKFTRMCVQPDFDIEQAWVHRPLGRPKGSKNKPKIELSPAEVQSVIGELLNGLAKELQK